MLSWLLHLINKISSDFLLHSDFPNCAEHTKVSIKNEQSKNKLIAILLMHIVPRPTLVSTWPSNALWLILNFSVQFPLFVFVQAFIFYLSSVPLFNANGNKFYFLLYSAKNILILVAISMYTVRENI